jgi:hypothetical protein
MARSAGGRDGCGGLVAREKIEVIRATPRDWTLAKAIIDTALKELKRHVEA